MTEEYKSEFIFQLTTPIFYQEGGDARVPTNEIILKAPSNKQRRETAKLKQGFFRAMKELQSENNNNEDVKKEGKEEQFGGTQMLSIIMMSKVDLVEYQETFRQLLLNNIAFVKEGQKLTSHAYDDISGEDSDNMMGEYISNFLLSSWMKKLTQE